MTKSLSRRDIPFKSCSYSKFHGPINIFIGESKADL